MTPLTSAIALLVLAVAIVAAFAVYLRWYANRVPQYGTAGRNGVDAVAGFGTRCEPAHCGDAGSD